MARFRLARRAQADILNILTESATRWGIEARRRYEAVLSSAMHNVAANPEGSMTRSRANIGPELRSYHLRHARQEASGRRVRRPVHVLYYRVVAPGLVEIVRVLHERMEPSAHLTASSGDET